MIDAERQELIEADIGYRFSRPEKLALALTHSSYANEAEVTVSNERLEFLGDAVLELVVSHELYKRFPHAAEGELTRLRSRLVKEKSLAQIARSIRLAEHLLLGRGEESQGGRERDALLSDALEALLGAVFVDGGFDAAKGFVLRLYEGLWPSSAELPKVKDHKTRLQEATQQTHKARPIYTQAGISGPDHARVYEVEVRLPDGRAFVAAGGSLKKAEQQAAALALAALGLEDDAEG